jgi:hypothetical protein
MLSSNYCRVRPKLLGELGPWLVDNMGSFFGPLASSHRLRFGP